MGHKFLRHIERTKVVVLVVDINGFQMSSEYPYRSPLDKIILLLKELSLYQELILSRPFLLVLNKMDTKDALQKRDEVFNELMSVDSTHPLLNGFEYGEVIAKQVKQFSKEDFANVFSVSALNCTGLDDLKYSLYNHVLLQQT